MMLVGRTYCNWHKIQSHCCTWSAPITITLIAPLFTLSWRTVLSLNLQSTGIKLLALRSPTFFTIQASTDVYAGIHVASVGSRNCTIHRDICIALRHKSDQKPDTFMQGIMPLTSLHTKIPLVFPQATLEQARACTAQMPLSQRSGISVLPRVSNIFMLHR